ncbi:YolD-like family protein [Jeotgalibacillus aurantiacus]|uniref:YolD-like family protein n=1 Tax=Jeotgalibacillus aurantiacus TaxID=2763266 RepID=UPI001D0B806C|nr:YolD-like family protein [Jeotgalibacillus aurantiacus]
MDSNDKDRGTIKWTSMMMPEHVAMLKDYLKNEYEAEEKPIMDEQVMEQIFMSIEESCEQHQTIDLHVHEKIKREKIRGRVTYIHFLDRYILMDTEQLFKRKIKFEDVVGMEFVE